MPNQITQLEWDIDANLPERSRDFIKLYSDVNGHLCDCHRGVDQCYGCEALGCEYHEHASAPTQREEFQSVFGVVDDANWQWLKEFVDRNYDATNWFDGVIGYRNTRTGALTHPNDVEIIRSR